MSVNIRRDDEWCPIHLKWESPEEDAECDRELYEAGYRNFAGIGPLKVFEANDVSNEMEGG